MAGAVQVLALSDDEDNLSCAWNTPRSRIQPRSRPQCTPITPVTGDIVCLDSDDETEIQGNRPPAVSEVNEPQQSAVQFELQPESTQACTPVTTIKTPDLLQQADEVDDCCILQEKPSSNSKVNGGRPISSLLDDCCIVKSTPSSSKVDKKMKSPVMDGCSERPSSSRRLTAVVDLDSQETTTVMSETGIQFPEFSRRRIEIFSIKDIMKQIPSTDGAPDAFEDPYRFPEVDEEIERPAKRRKKTHVAALASPSCDTEMNLETRHVAALASPSCDMEMNLETRHVAALASPSCDTEMNLETRHVAALASPSCDMEMNLETRHEGEEEPCGGEIQRTASRGQKISEEERQRRLREKELEFERKQAERSEKKREKEEAKKKQQEEILQKKEEEKARKLAAKKAAKEKKKAENEVEKFKRKAALEHMVASVDTSVAEKGLIGGQLLSRFVEKKLRFTLVSNPIKNSITWCTKRLRLESQEIDESQDTEPSQDEFVSSQVVQEEVNIQYILFVFEAEEFSTMVAESSLTSHVREVQQRYPDYTVCYLVNKLMSFLQKKDQAQYESNDPSNAGRWKRPPVEKALAGLTTNFTGVHSRLCVDEADVADHLTGLMQSFADCLYKPKLTRLSVNKDGDHVRSDDPFKEEIRKSQWLKALVAIPKVSGPCAMAVGRVYPSMRSLLRVYLDNGKTDREKELLLQDLQRESIFGSTAGQRIGAVCSKQIFRVLMAQNGNLKVDKIDQVAHEE